MGRKYRHLEDLGNERGPSKAPVKNRRPPDYEQRRKAEREKLRREKRRER